MNKKFPGFRSPKYTQVPDEVFDDLLPDLNKSELKVLLYIIRRTFGFKKENDNISTHQIMNGIKTKDGKQLDKGTGLSNRAVINAVRSLEEKNIIIAHRRVDKEKGNLPTTYSLNILTPYEENTQGGGIKSSQGVVNKVHTQETVLQETDNNVNVVLQIPKKKKYYIDALIIQMEEILNDKHSRDFYKIIARNCPSQMIYTALSQVKDADAQGQIKKSRAALFTGLIKKMAREAQIQLNLRKP